MGNRPPKRSCIVWAALRALFSATSTSSLSAPRLTHEADSLELVDDLVVAGLGVGLLPMDRPVAEGVEVLTLDDPAVWMRAAAVTRRGATAWPPLALVVEHVTGS